MRTTPTRLATLYAVRALGAALVAVLAQTTPSQAQTTHRVDLESFTFVPASLNVEVGDTVEWVWVVGLHNVISGDGVPDGHFNSGIAVPPPAAFSVTFDQAFLDANPVPGNDYEYYCEVHLGIGMTGNVQVGGPGSGGPPWGGSSAGSSAPATPDSGASILLSEGFDDVIAPNLPAGWTSGAHAGDAGNTAWELGVPATVGPSSAYSPRHCVGTDLDDNYGPDTNIWLRTPLIDLTDGPEQATLSFRQFKDFEAGVNDLDYGTIRILAANLTELAVVEAEVEGVSLDWENFRVALPPEAFAEPILIEFQARTDGDNLSGGVENGGFEVPTLPNGSYNSTGGPGWSITGSGGIWNPSTAGFPGEAPEGQNVGWVDGGSLRQTLSATLAANTQYVLSAQVGNSLNFGSGSGNTYRIELRTGGVLLASDAGSAPPLGQFAAKSLVYDSGSTPPQEGQPLEIRLIADGSAEIDYDAVTLTGIKQTELDFAGWYIDDVEVRFGATGLWQLLPNSPVAPFFHHDDLVFIDDDTGWLCNISGQIFKTTDGGASWTMVLNQPASAFRALTFADEMNGWVGNLGPGSWVQGVSDTNPLYSTTDGGLTWTPITNVTGSLPDGICGLHAVGNTIHGAGRYAGDAYFISSTDGGASWVSQDLSGSYNAFVDVLFFTPDEGYITSSNSLGNAALLQTSDGGATWTTRIVNNAYHYWKLGFASPTFGYGVAWGGIDGDTWIQTYDGGQTWTDRVYAGGYEANGIGFLDEQTGWIGGDESSTYQTLDGGDSWQLIKLDPDYPDNINKFVRVSDTLIYGVGTRIYRYSANQGLTVGGSDGFDNSLCELSAVSSRGGTAITYTVPEDDHVQVTIYIKGGLVYDRPVDQRQRAGTYTIDYTAHDDTRVLYASIVTGRYRQVIKFINPRSKERAQVGSRR